MAMGMAATMGRIESAGCKNMTCTHNTVSGTTRQKPYARCCGTCRVGRFCGSFRKRAFDLAGALILLPFLLPVVLVLCLIVMRDGGAPIYGHTRIGREGRAFKCWKLRSMVSDSHLRLQQHLASIPAAREEWATNFKLRDDPRITPFGRMLRRTSLDELPQIWNVLRGDMSLVGPRPVTRSELRMYGAALDHYLALRPGVTGLWQVSGRNEVSYDERVLLDVDYAHNCSWRLDLQIIFRTLPTVVTRTGK